MVLKGKQNDCFYNFIFNRTHTPYLKMCFFDKMYLKENHVKTVHIFYYVQIEINESNVKNVGLNFI